MVARSSIAYRYGLALLLAVGGCAGCAPTNAALTPSQARQALDAIYAGSLAPVPLDPRFLQGMNDALTRDTAMLLRDQFGATKRVQFQSSGKANPQVLETIWTVTAEKRSFEMKIWQLDGRISGFWFRPSAAQDWGPVPMIGVEYARQKRLPAGW